MSKKLGEHIENTLNLLDVLLVEETDKFKRAGLKTIRSTLLYLLSIAENYEKNVS